MYKIFNSFLSFSKIISYLIWNTVTWTLLESTLICRHDVIVNIWYHQVFPASLPQVQFACPLKVFSDTPLERLVKVKRTHSFRKQYHGCKYLHCTMDCHHTTGKLKNVNGKLILHFTFFNFSSVLMKRFTLS